MLIWHAFVIVRLFGGGVFVSCWNVVESVWLFHAWLFKVVESDLIGYLVHGRSKLVRKFCFVRAICLVITCMGGSRYFLCCES